MFGSTIMGQGNLDCRKKWVLQPRGGSGNRKPQSSFRPGVLSVGQVNRRRVTYMNN